MTKQQWEQYKEKELKTARAIASRLGFRLRHKQPHLQGERYLMSGPKLVLLAAARRSQQPVIIKISSRRPGKKEIKSEWQAHQKLNSLNFAYHSFALPKQILFKKIGPTLILITEFIAQKKPFLAYSGQEQFFFALRALAAQEGAQAIASSHLKEIKKIFKRALAADYLKNFSTFKKNILAVNPALAKTLAAAQKFLDSKRPIIEFYADFLTHSDFVPHNIRLAGGKIYLLDHTSLLFGNKYESWARFINYMALYNQSLAQALAGYVQKNRPPEEYLSLRLMRVYKLGFLLQFYAQSLPKTAGNLRLLNQKRLDFWAQILADVLADRPTAPAVIKNYQQARDRLRSDEEKIRQKNI